ncbi:MAG: class I SAM-dependent methyltransferase [Burkholderiaceae bacterium]|jgi:hypothetical protein|nr:class I SAM-dependent methyltransferase [Burkholderiaceae bacterium]
MQGLQEKLFGLAAWDSGKITDEWFRVHFDHAADIVHDWLGQSLNLSKARLLNFGCGDGITDLALVLRHGAASIHGIDIRREYQKLPRIAREQLGMTRLPAALRFETIVPNSPLAGRVRAFDGIFSWSTFEHVQRDKVLPILMDLHACLRAGGVFFLQVEPLFYSPWGSHLGRYVDVPWHHLMMTQEELWRAIQAYDGPINPTEVDFGFDDFGVDGYKQFVFREYQALNRLTADELVDIARQAGFEVLREKRQSHYMDMPIPPTLQARYPEDWLRGNEIFLLLGKT